MNNRCPLTSYVIVGFSQGAVIAGDIASDIGNGRGPVDADLVLGVTLDRGRPQAGRRRPGHRPQPRRGRVPRSRCRRCRRCPSLGLTMTGPRPGGFGALNDRTNQICGAGDLICAAPEGAFSIVNLPKTLETLSGAQASPCTRCTTHPSSGCSTDRPRRVDAGAGRRASSTMRRIRSTVESRRGIVARIWRRPARRLTLREK